MHIVISEPVIAELIYNTYDFISHIYEFIN